MPITETQAMEIMRIALVTVIASGRGKNKLSRLVRGAEGDDNRSGLRMAALHKGDKDFTRYGRVVHDGPGTGGHTLRRPNHALGLGLPLGRR